MGVRRKAREHAVQILFQMDIINLNAREAIDRFTSFLHGDEKVLPFTQELVYGVEKHKNRIDGIIQEHSKNWRLDRMSFVDRNILRMALFELLFENDIPPRVTLNEAIDLGKKFGTEESGGFINGILDSVYNGKCTDIEGEFDENGGTAPQKV